MPQAQRLRDRRRQNHQRLPVAGAARNSRGEDQALGSCYRRAIELCEIHGLVSIAFPAISTGVYGFPADRAAGIAVSTTAEALSRAPAVRRIIFCCFSLTSARLHAHSVSGLGNPCAH
jgi:O-acetyl-ADP-ribose deacetylase (regulator of RNase III)